ncbi:MAG: hypothetical protein AAGF81_01385 [Pseudomonadota bacterium]
MAPRASTAAKNSDGKSKQSADTLKRQKEVCRDHGVHLLRLLADSDGAFGSDELNAIMDYCTSCLSSMKLAPTLEQRPHLARYIKQLRATENMVSKSVAQLTNSPEDVQSRFLKGCVAVASVHSDEVRPDVQLAVNRLSKEIMGREFL